MKSIHADNVKQSTQIDFLPVVTTPPSSPLSSLQGIFAYLMMPTTFSQIRRSNISDPVCREPHALFESGEDGVVV